MLDIKWFINLFYIEYLKKNDTKNLLLFIILNF